MANIYSNIRAALENKLNSISGLPDIAWENVKFDPTIGNDYIQPIFAPVYRQPAVRGLTPQQEYRGLYRINCYSKENTGPSSADSIASTIIDEFEATTDISYDVDTNTTIIVSIRYAERGQGESISPWYYVPVDIGWYIYN